jgi:solute carrier family 25 carnitine/acylcarnitine transporter 20/29
MNEYLIGNICGISQVVIGYPFDTLKTNIQNSKSIKIFVKKPLSLYAGVRFPLMVNIIGTTFMFGNYHNLLEYTNNRFTAATITGIIGSFLITPFDYFKIHNQSFINNSSISSISSISVSKLPLYYSGLSYTILRESISIPAYFITFDILHNEHNINPFLSGAMAGVNSWLLTYPIDTLKTRRQLYPNKTFKHILEMGKLYNGLCITLIRAFIVNGINFQLYTSIKKNL